MSAKIHGLQVGQLAPGPDLFLSRDAEGLSTARRTFSCLKNSLSNPFIQSKLAKGTPITTLCSDLPAAFADLQVDSFESQDNPGGITTVAVTFTGYTAEGEYSYDREITYSLRGVVYRRSITEHPKFISDMEAANAVVRESFVALLLKEAYATGTSAANYRVIRNSNDEEIVGVGGWIDNATNAAWWDIIVTKGLREYDAASYEWTRATANAGGLTNTEIADLGKQDDPPGSPPEPTEEGWWQLVDLSDERSSNASSNTLTWRFVPGVVIEKLYVD
jgi:hypothetical protein